MRRLEGQAAIVTGAAQGLGEAIARRLAAEGCAGITVADMNGELAAAVAADIATVAGCPAIATTTDVTDEAAAFDMVRRTRDAFGSVDILVANAGILIAEDIMEFPPARWRKVIDVNLLGYMVCAQAAARAMAERKRGAIVQINSKSGKKGSFRNSADRKSVV